VVLVSCSLLTAFFIHDAQTEFLDQMICDSGQIVWLSFERVFWGIVSDIGMGHYQPVNLPEDLEIDGLRVFFIAELLTYDSLSMWGYHVRLLYINEI
jgi:hypothetical protein